jgi:hypothetical protein
MDGSQMGVCRGWIAIQHPEPGLGVLVVQGTCQFPTAGFAVELRRHEPQVNPDDLLLDRIVNPPNGPAAQVTTDIRVGYSEEREGLGQFKTVTILPDGQSIPVKFSTRN